MKASILIVSYLLKDIWCRWLETPGAVAARVVVAGLLALLMLFVQAAFVLAARSLESRVHAFGANLVVVFANHSHSDVSHGRTPLGTLLAPLRSEGGLVTLKVAHLSAQTEYGQPLAVVAYDDASLPGLATHLSGTDHAGIVLLTEAFVSGMPVGCLIEGIELQATVRPLPAQLGSVLGRTDVLLIPEGTISEALARGHQELALFTANDAERAPMIGTAIQSLLDTEGFQGTQVRSAAAWLDELAALRDRQMKWQTTLAALCLAVLVLVFGSIALLEYRQNSFIAALLRSFGAPRVALMGRYLVEGLMLMALAAGIAFLAARTSHGPLFTLAGFEAPWTDLAHIDPYRWRENLPLLVAFAAAAILGTLPVAWALRRPVGRVLA